MTSWDHPPRQVTLLLCTREGEVLGTLPPFEIEVPWWQEAGPVVEGARAAYDVDVTVLRLIAHETGWNTAGGAVTYLAEVATPPTAPLEQWTGPDPMADHPLRLPWMRPGGPDDDVAWADAALEAAGRPRNGRAHQVKTWNLSSVWRLPTPEGPAWLKVVPPFFAHEGAMLQRMRSADVPPLIATEGHRLLLEDVPGQDHWGAELPVLERVVTMLVGLQAEWTHRVDELVEMGAPDWRVDAFVPAAARLLDVVGGLSDDERTALRALVDGLPEVFAAVAECGVPDSFVHGDFHPGNTRGSDAPDGRSVLLDWGDCGIGNPLLDQAATLASIREDQRDPLRRHWSRLWRDAVPGSDPERAADLLGPVRAFRQALIYQVFLEGIEPSERVYHEGDPAHWLRAAVAGTR
jgi:hypothetical protein